MAYYRALYASGYETAISKLYIVLASNYYVNTETTYISYYLAQNTKINFRKSQ